MNNYHKIAQLGRLAAMEKVGQRAFFRPPKPKKVPRPPKPVQGPVLPPHFDNAAGTGRLSADDWHHKWMNDGTPKRYDPRTKKWRQATGWEQMEENVGLAARLGALGGVGYMGGKSLFRDREQDRIDTERIMKKREADERLKTPGGGWPTHTLEPGWREKLTADKPADKTTVDREKQNIDKYAMQPADQTPRHDCHGVHPNQTHEEWKASLEKGHEKAAQRAFFKPKPPTSAVARGFSPFAPSSVGGRLRPDLERLAKRYGIPHDQYLNILKGDKPLGTRPLTQRGQYDPKKIRSAILGAGATVGAVGGGAALSSGYGPGGEKSNEIIDKVRGLAEPLNRLLRGPRKPSKALPHQDYPVP